MAKFTDQIKKSDRDVIKKTLGDKVGEKFRNGKKAEAVKIIKEINKNKGMSISGWDSACRV